MAKALKIAAGVVAIAGLALVTGGLAAGASLSFVLGASSGLAGLTVSGLFTAAALLNTGASLLSPKPKVPDTSQSNADRLTVSINTRAPRVSVVGSTAMATDLRDQEWSADQAYLHRFVVAASHKAAAIREIWFDDKLAWTSSGGVQGAFAGFLSVVPVLEGSAANAINIGPRMGSLRRYTGCAYVYLRYKLSKNGKTDSPFASSIPSRMTIVGDGAFFYDPRLDSTVPGGSGPMRPDDQSTWAWNPNACRNPALAMLFYLLGWRIQNPSTGAWKLAVGKGIPAARIDLASFITAANLCDEAVTTAAGGTEPRYRCDGVWSEQDEPGTVLENLKATMNAVLDDVDGKIRVTVLHNDLGAPIGTLTAADVQGDFTWTQTPALSDCVNVLRGGYTDASTVSLYQLVDFPEARIASPDGIDRAQTLNLPLVQSPSQAQRLVKTRLQRAQYPGAFQATFLSTAWAYQKGDVVRFDFFPLGWSGKLFRIADMATQVDGLVPMMLREEHASIYAFDGTEVGAVQGAQPTTYDPSLWPLVQGIVDAGKTAEWTGVTGPGRPADDATNSADPNSPLGPIRTVGEALATLDRIEPIALKTDVLEKAQIDQDALLRQADSDRAALAAAQISGLLDQNVQRVTLRNAGLVTDPATGRVYIFAVDQTQQRVSQVEIGLDAAAGQIALRATYNDVSTMITQAQLSPGDAAQFGELISRMNAAEIDIDGMQAALTLKADAITVTTLGGIVQNVTQTLDALAGTLGNKVSYTDFNPVRDRVGTVEQTLLSYGDVSSYGVTVRQAELRGNAGTAAQLADVVGSFENGRRQVARAAEVQQQLYARLVDGDAAEAAARLLLTVRVGDAEGKIAQEQYIRATETGALTRSVSGLSAQFGDLSGVVTRLSEATTAASQAQARDIAQLTTKFGDLDASVTRLSEATSSDSQAQARDIAQISARIGDFGLVTVQQAFAAIADRTGKIEGTATLAIDTNGNLVGTQLIGSANGPGTLNLINADLRMGTGRVIFNNGTFMRVQGTGFGVNSEFLSWFGPTMAISQCSRANAVSYETVTGNAYFGGSLTVGTIKNAVRTTSTAADARLSTGPLGSNGRRRVVTLSYEWARYAEQNSAQVASNGSIGAQVTLFRNGAAWITLPVSGTYARTSYGGSASPATYTETMSGSMTADDTIGGANVTYEAVLSNRGLGPGPSSSNPISDSFSQTISITETEE